MGLDMYAYRMPLDTLSKWQEEYAPDDVDDTWYSFNPRMAARQVQGFKHLTDAELSKKTQLERDWYWDTIRVADAQVDKLQLLEVNYHYWRKFNALHGWMENLWRERSGAGDAENFNCTTVRLGKEDLDRLYAERNSLTPVGGFFFGAKEVYPEDVKSLETFLEKARKDVDTNAIFYDSWW